MQQCIETLAKFAAECAHALQPATFVVFDKTHAGQAIQQAMFGLANHPVQLGVRQARAQCMQQWQHMGDIAQCRQAQQANGAGGFEIRHVLLHS